MSIIRGDLAPYHSPPIARSHLHASTNTPKTHQNKQNWGETWLYNEQAIGETVKILEGMAMYVKYLDENLRLDNVMMLQLVNEPWVFLDMGCVRGAVPLRASSRSDTHT